MKLKDLQRKKVSAISLGCDKNRVDLEEMLFKLNSMGLKFTPDLNKAHIIIINTCGFIKPAVLEAHESIKEALALKKTKKCEKIIVTGCLVSRYGKEYKKFKDVDAILNVNENDKIVATVLSLYGLSDEIKEARGRMLTNVPHFAYLKISDGCNNFCTYCTIPKIRGRYKSVPMERLMEDATMLAKGGVKELILVAQDTTRYGTDIYGEPHFVELIKNISKIDGIKWIRLHYCYPELVTDELLDEIKNNPKVCKYIDIPFQHIDDKILKKMNRRTNEAQVKKLVENINTNYPEISIRSTFIVGFPGETRVEFNKLVEFLKWAKLSHAGFFKYSKEQGTPAYDMPNQVSESTKQRRLEFIENVQYEVAYNKNSELCGQVRDVIIDGYDAKENIYYGRMDYDTPESDYFVVIDKFKQPLNIGDIYKLKINLFNYNYYFAEEQ